MSVHYISDKNDDGASFGQSASDLISFHGASPVDQAAFTATNSIGAISVSGVVGFSSSAALSNTLVLLNAIQALLVEKGLMASA